MARHREGTGDLIVGVGNRIPVHIDKGHGAVRKGHR